MSTRRGSNPPLFAARASATRPTSRRLAGSALHPPPAAAPTQPVKAVEPLTVRPSPATPRPISAAKVESGTRAETAPQAAAGSEVVLPPEHFRRGSTSGATSSHDDAAEQAVELDWDVVRQLRSMVSEAVTHELPTSTRLSRELHADLVASCTHEALRDVTATSAIAGKRQMTTQQRQAYTTAIADAFFGAGRFQRLMEQDGIENIEVEGHESVTATYADGSVRYLPALFGSDEELIEEITHLARTAHTGEKDFSPASQTLRMSLPDGSRLAAEAWHCRPSATIRVHRYVDTDLEQIMALGTVDESLTQFLAACIRAGFNMIIAGDAAAGKTTLARGILNALDENVRLATIESMYELGLDKLPHRHKRVWAAEAQPGGEPGPDGRPRGLITLSDLVAAALQKNVQRVVVGEVTGGAEVAAMLEAMQAAKGCLTTIHASSAPDSLERLATLLMGTRANTSFEFASRLIAQNVHVVVHLALRQDPTTRINRRYVDEVVAMAPSSEPGVPAEITTIYAPGRDGRARPTGDVPPSWEDPLRSVGFDLSWLTNRVDTWGAA